MNVISRGIRNAFRNGIRTTSIVIILALSIGLALTMQVARQAVQNKIDSVKSSIGNTISISPAGARGFEGGGEALTDDQMNKVRSTPHVVALSETLNDRLDSTQTNLQSAIDPGTLGRRARRFEGGGSGGSGSGVDGGQAPSSLGGGGGPSSAFTLPIMVIGTNSTTGSVLGGAGGGGTLKLTSGQNVDPTKDQAIALLGADLATKNNLKAGSTFTAYGTTFTVSGIFDAGNKFANSQLVMSLSTVQRLSQQTGAVTSATAQVDSISNVSAATASIKSTLGDGADVVSQQDTSAEALQPLENIKNISLFSLIGAVVAAAVIILLTMVMIVRERRREIGVLKAIGASNIKIMTQFMSEAVTFTLMGAFVGLGVGVLGSNPVTQMLVTSSSNSTATSGGGLGGGGFGPGGGFGGGRALRAAGLGRVNLHSIQASAGWEIVLYGLAAAIIIALVGSAFPAWLIARVRPAEVMRTE